MTTKSLITTMIAIILFFGLGIFIGTKIKPKAVVPGNQENTYQAGWDAAKKRLEEKGVGTMPVGMEIKNLGGTIDTISDQKIVLKNIISPDLLGDASLDTRTVQITADTKIYQLIQKDPTQFQAEMDDFTKKMKEQSGNATANSQMLTPPQPQDKKEIALADLKPGQIINVTSNDNIRDKKEFIATEISAQVMFTPSTITTTNNNSNPVPPMPITSPSNAGATTTVPTPVPPIK